jgi:hypothetical protein
MSLTVLLLALAAAAVAIWLVLPGRAGGLIPTGEREGRLDVVTAKTLAFSVDAKALLRATSFGEFGAPPEFANYWQFQIVSLAAEGKRVSSGEQLIAFDAQKIRDDLQRFQTELDQANKELEKTSAQIDLEVQDLKGRLAAAENNFEKLKLKQTMSTQFDVQYRRREDRLAYEQARTEVAAAQGANLLAQEVERGHISDHRHQERTFSEPRSTASNGAWRPSKPNRIVKVSSSTR